MAFKSIYSMYWGIIIGTTTITFCESTLHGNSYIINQLAMRSAAVIKRFFPKRTPVQAPPTLTMPQQEKITIIGQMEIPQAIQKSSVHSILNTLDKLSQDQRVQGIVIYMDSPGGFGGSSELVFLKIKSIKKPVVVVVVNECNSGAYLAACAARWIVAPSLSEVGSIGGWTLLERHTNQHMKTNEYEADITYTLIKAGHYKSLHHPQAAPPTQEDIEYVQKKMDQCYKIFCEKVSIARNLPLEKKDEWANGKTFTGAEALALGLVDQIGGVDDAIKKLVELIYGSKDANPGKVITIGTQQTTQER